VQPAASLIQDLDGAFRPGHFNGVATVVLKLFNLVQPRVAVFGKKDFQQLLVIRELVRQFNLPIGIIAGDTLREADGLAMSSRNGYLGASERIQATLLQRELAAIRASVEAGERDFAGLSATACRHLKMAAGVLIMSNCVMPGICSPPRPPASNWWCWVRPGWARPG